LLKRLVSGTILVVVLMVVLPLVCNVNSVLAYNKGTGGTHYFIFDQARTILGNDGFVSYQEFLDSVAEPGKTYLDKMKEGSDEADTWETFASRDHYMSPMDHVGLYIFPFQSKSAATLCQEKFDEALNHWVVDQSGSEAMKDLGWAAHLIQDLCVPFHAAEDTGSLIIPPNRHSDYENWVQSCQNDFVVYSGGEYSFPSFPDRQYYPTGNSGPPSQAYWHYNGSNPTAYDWADYNAHEGLKYYLCVNYATGTWNNYAEPCIETVHYLPNNLDSTWTITMNESTRFQLHFSRINISLGDYVRIYDKNDNLLASYTNLSLTDWWAPSSSSWYNSGDTLKIRTTTDGTGMSWGYDIHDIKSDDIGNDLEGATNILLPRAQRTTAGFIKFFFDKVLNPLYIRSDGSIDPSTAPIQRNGDVYTLTGNVSAPIVVEKDNLVIDGNCHTLHATQNVGDGFYLSGRSNVTIQNVTVEGFWSGIFAWNSTNVTITRNALENNKNAIRLYNSSDNNTISGNNITENTSDYVGISIYSSSNSQIVENTITASSPPFTGGSAIALEQAFNNKIIENNITAGGEGCGISLYFSSNNTLSKNRIDATHGISISKSNSNTIIGNKIESFYYCILLYDTLSNIFYHNSMGPSWYQVYCHNSTSRWDDGYPSGGNYWSDYTGIDLYSGPYQNITGSDGICDAPYVIDANNRDKYPLMKPYNGPVRNLNNGQSYPTIQKAISNAIEGDRIFVLSGLYYENVVINKAVSLIGEDKETTIIDGNRTGNGAVRVCVANVTLSRFTIRNDLWGIKCDLNSINANLFENDITNSSYGIDLFGSSNNSILRNSITNCEHIGISCDGRYNSIYENSLTNNKYGIWLGNQNNTIYGNNMTNNQYGITLVSCQYISIYENNVTNNGYGIQLFDCFDCKIYGNNVSNNQYGIYLYPINDQINNRIYHNSFIDNTQQSYVHGLFWNTWDDGYPSGGNYWSDYTGADLYSGPYQNITGSDGIGDTPYIIDENNRDRYPLTKPYGGPNDIGITHLTTSKTVIGQGYNLSINVEMINYGINTEAFNLTVYANTSILQSLTNIVLTSRSSTTITFTWDTSGFAKGNYTISAYAWPVPGETDTEDNTFINGWVYVGLVGDVNADGIVDIADIYLIELAYGTMPGQPGYKPNLDINSDSIIDIEDIYIASLHYGGIIP
jgi:parallel beta-helix repeat protein